MSRRGNGTFGEVIVGLFMIAVIAIMAYFTIVISGVDVIRGNNKVNINIVFDQVGGLKDHDNVMYRGTKVGKIEEVMVTPTNLVVTASVLKSVVLRETCSIAVCNLSMLGGNYLLLEEGEGEVIDIENTLFKGETPVDWMRDVAKITDNVRKITEMNEIRRVASNIVEVTDKAVLLMDKANDIAAGADQFVGKVNAAADDLQATVDESRAFLASAKGAAESVGAAADGITMTLDDAKAFLVGAKGAADAIEAAADKAGSILGTVDNEKDQLVTDLKAGVAAFRASAESFNGQELMATANELANNLNELSRRLKDGEGTLGKLVNDSTMYDEVQGMVRDARQVLDNYRDTTPITTFSSLATGAL